MPPIGLSLTAGLNQGHDSANADLLDINGDGLPDRVLRSGGTLLVQLNVGYGFLDAEPFASAAINSGNSVSGSVSLGFNGGIYDFAGGASADRGESSTRDLSPFQSAGETLADMNGDGLLDRVLPSSGNSVLVGINTGAGFAPLVPWNGVPGNDIAHSANLSVGGGVFFTIGIPLSPAGTIISPGVAFNAAMDARRSRSATSTATASPIVSSTAATSCGRANLTGRTASCR
jgi:hypothetical protein